METVRDHYDSFLGSVYSWILGDFGAAYEANLRFFQSLNLAPEPGAIAVDLGCGPGCQSVPLAELGFDVLAVDFCQPLLDELKSHAKGLAIRTICDDMQHFASHIAGPVDLIVCMGDSLVHLPHVAAVETLLGEVYHSLRPGGTFIYAIRDYVSQVPQGADRFIPIRADDRQIFTCFLDYRDDVVHVHDVLYVKAGDEWKMRISDYLKLRLDSKEINAELQRLGLTIADSTPAVESMITVVARKPA